MSLVLALVSARRVGIATCPSVSQQAKAMGQRAGQMDPQLHSFGIAEHGYTSHLSVEEFCPCQRLISWSVKAERASRKRQRRQPLDSRMHPWVGMPVVSARVAMHRRSGAYAPR